MIQMVDECFSHLSPGFVEIRCLSELSWDLDLDSWTDVIVIFQFCSCYKIRILHIVDATKNQNATCHKKYFWIVKNPVPNPSGK